MIYDIMQYTELHNIPGLLLLVDFEKAFDALSWSFIDRALDIFNFKTSIKNWIKTFYTNAVSRVLQNGYLSDIKLQRGCRQGDPLASYIFIICAKILSILVRNNNNIKSITIDGTEYQISQYADDTTFILDGSAQSLENTMTVLDYYADISGLKINYTKSKAIWIGNKNISKDVYHHTRWMLEWAEHEFTMLDINFVIDLNKIVDCNFDSKIRQMQNLIFFFLENLRA